MRLKSRALRSLLRLVTVSEVSLVPWAARLVINAVRYYIGRYVFDLAFDHVIDVAIVSHPSLLKSPQDLEV